MSKKQYTEKDYNRYMERVNNIISNYKILITELSVWEDISKTKLEEWIKWMEKQ